MKISHMGTNYICSQSFVLDRPAGTSDYLYVMFKSSAFVLSENKLICAEPGSYIVYHPLSPQKYYPHKSVFIHDFAHLMPETSEEEGFLERLTCDTLIYPDTVEYINQICLQLCMEYFSNSKYKSQAIDSFCRLLILKLFEHNRSEMGKPTRLNYQYELLRLRSEVYSNPQLHWTVKMMADRIALSEAYFHRLYRKVFNVSCIEDVISARIVKARQMLLHSASPISEVAHFCGYDNVEHFSRQFKTITGLSPVYFRCDGVHTSNTRKSYARSSGKNL